MTADELAAEVTAWTPHAPGSAGTCGDGWRADWDDPPIPAPRSGDDSNDGRTAE